MHVHGVLQTNCAKGAARCIINEHEMNIDPFSTWEDLCEWCNGSTKTEDNANQIRFKLDALKLNSRTSADQCAQDFLWLRVDLNSLGEGCASFTHVSNFVDDIACLDFAEDVRDLAHNGSSLADCMKSARRIQRKIDLDHERNRTSTSESMQLCVAQESPSHPQEPQLTFPNSSQKMVLSVCLMKMCNVKWWIQNQD